MINAIQFIGLFILLMAMYFVGKHCGKIETLENINYQQLCNILEDLFGKPETDEDLEE